MVKKSEQKVNYKKTDLCLFFKQDTTPVSIIGFAVVRSKGEINVLGVVFNSKLA